MEANFSKTMTPNQKNIAYVAGGLVVALIGYNMFLKSDNGGSAEDPTGNGGITNPGSGTGNGASFNAVNVANALYDAMKTTGTNESKILTVLQNVNQPRFGEVVKAFGKKSYNDTFGNQINYGIFPLPMHDLPYWLESELSEEEYNILFMKYPNYL